MRAVRFRPNPSPLSRFELVAMTAAFMALNAFGVDIMLPALPQIVSDFGLDDPNAAQLTIYVYLFSYGIGQLAYGPLADSFGRRTVLLASICAYLAATLAVMLAPGFWMFLAARAVQGATAAAGRVVAVAVVRDLASGAAMAQIMSHAMVAFLIAPMIAPAIGQAVLFIAPWPFLFGLLFALGAGLGIWAYIRMPETLPPENRPRISLRGVARSYAAVALTPGVSAYALAMTLTFACVSAYIGSSQQILGEHFGLGAAFPLAFAGIAGAMAIGSLANARLVARHGPRRMGASALAAFVAISLGHALLLTAGYENVWTFLVLLAAAMIAFAMTGANFNALAMEPLGARAGVGASFLGFSTTAAGAVIGGYIAQLYDGTPSPLIWGHAALSGLALLVVVGIERAAIFQPRARV